MESEWANFRTSSWIMVILSLLSAFPQIWKWDVLRPCIPVHGIPMISCIFSMLPACATEDSAAHLHPDLVVMHACLTCSSWESLYVITILLLGPLKLLHHG